MVALKPVLTLLALATTLTASPLAADSPQGKRDPSPWHPHPACLNVGIASGLVQGFASLLTNFSAAEATSVLSPKFTDTSDSINFLIGTPLGNTTFPSLQAFIAGQGAQPPIGFTVLSIDAITCNVVAFRWEAILSKTAPPIKGINIFYAKQSGNGALGVGGFQIETNFSEFNSASWDVEVGGTCTPPHFGK